jgi:hypothetical protein
MIFSDEVVEGIWIDSEKTQVAILLKNKKNNNTYSIQTSAGTEHWEEFFKIFTPKEIDDFSHAHSQRKIINQKKEEESDKAQDDLKNLFDAKLKAFEISEVKESKDKILRSKIRKSTNLVELNAWVTVLLLKSISDPIHGLTEWGNILKPVIKENE